MSTMNIYRAFCTRIYSLLCAHGTFSTTYHILKYKTSLNKFNEIDFTLSIFSKYNALKLEMNYQKKTGQTANMWKLNNMLLNNAWVKKEITEELKRYRDK